jgi:hypothetical protein
MIPAWLFDELADNVTDPDELRVRLEAWNELLDGAVDDPAYGAYLDALDRAHGWTVQRIEFMDRYRELRADGAGSWEGYALSKTVRSGHWKATEPVDPHAACRQPDGYCCPACAAEILGVSRQRLANLRKAGELQTIGVAPKVFYLHADLGREAS